MGNHIKVAMLIMMLATSAQADTWLNLGGPSYHLDRTKPFNERNYGLGLRHDISESSFVAAGFYDNSINQRSRYALYGHDLYQRKGFSAGLVGGAVDGYNIRQGKPIPFAAPYVSFAVFKRLSADIIYVPKVEKKVSAVFGLQVRIKL